MPESFVIYRSSAGSGKTYTLVKEYLLLALKNPQENYRHILAITFTNKAMQEMKNRIITSLAEFSTGKSHPMKDELIKSLGINEKEFLKRCKMLQEKILHEYSYFSISTIDAFFQKIIRSFTKELGLYGQYQLELNQDLVKLQAIDNLLADLKEDQDITKWVVKFAEEQLDDGRNWDIRRSLSEFAGEIFKESFAEVEDQLPDATSIKEFQASLSKEIKIFEQQLYSYSHQAMIGMEKNNVAVEDFKYNKGGALAFLYKVGDNNIEDPKNRSTKGCHDIDEWVSKKDPRYDSLAAIAEQHLMPILQDAVDFYHKNKERYYSALAAIKFIYGFGLLADLGKKVREYKHDRDLLFIQDATKLIQALMKETDTPFIFEKIGTFYNHYLIDEFQDTSALQWRCLHPLVFDTVSSGNMNMVVGDTKQSIYRWRGGDWSLLQHQVIEDLYPHPHKLMLLNNNFRSGGEIISFNNSLFNQLPREILDITAGEIEGIKDESIKLFEQIAGVYNEATQKIPLDKKEQGYVRISFIENNEDDHWTEQVLPLFIEQLEDLLKRGYHLKDVAVLVRKKDEAALVAQHLLNFSNSDGSPKYPVLTNEALLIKNSRAVMVLINTLRFMQSYDDQIALAELIYHHQRIFDSNNNISFHDIFNREKKVNLEILPFDLEKEKNYLMHLPVEEAVEHLIRLYDLPGESGEAAYLQTFQDKVLEFGRSEGNDIGSFLLWWEEKGQNESINVPSGLDAISIMTIHKAKGLQFPVVIVPFTSWAINSSSRTILWAEGTEEPYDGKRLPLKFTGDLSKTIFKDYYFQEKLQAALDSLNMLYVAYTRAEQELYSFAPSDSKYPNIGTYLLSSLSNEESELYKLWSPQSMTYESGKKSVFSRKEESIPEQVTIEKYLSHSWRERLVIKKISSEHAGLHEKVLRGTRMHHLLSKIKYKRDLTEKSFFTSFQDEELKKDLEEAISHPDIVDFFSPSYKVLNEKSILSKDNIFRPDRVVIKEDEAIVIDYKWGEKQNHYKNQIKIYLELLRSMGYNKTAGYLYYVDQKSVEKVA